MLALTDQGLAHLCIAATAIPRRARREWLRKLVRTIENRDGNLTRKRRQIEREKNGLRRVELWISDIALEGLVAQLVATGKLSDVEASDHVRLETALAGSLEEQGLSWRR
jgi:DNA-binding transcriptional regulator PaaX